MVIDRDKLDMRCPKCTRFSLKELDSGVICGFCKNKLSRGQETNFRLYKLLKKDRSFKKGSYKKISLSISIINHHNFKVIEY